MSVSYELLLDIKWEITLNESLYSSVKCSALQRCKIQCSAMQCTVCQHSVMQFTAERRKFDGLIRYIIIHFGIMNLKLRRMKASSNLQILIYHINV